MTPLQNTTIGILAFACCAAQCAAQERLSARELFYSPAPAAVAKSAAASGKKAAKTPQRTAEARRRPERRQSPPPSTRTETDQTETARTKPPRVEAQIIPVSHQMKPLALRYSVMRLAGGGSFEEVDPDSVFRSGDRIRVTLQVNDPGYLYVVHQGSSGVWKVLFPSAEVGNGSNRVSPGQSYEIPPGGRFYFDEQAGVERLFLVVARQPVDDLDSLIYSVRPSSAPAKKTGQQEAAPMLLAQNIQPVGDSLIQQIRSEVLARDLVFEKVDETTPGERREKAVYAAVVEGGDAARVVADIQLRHQ